MKISQPRTQVWQTPAGDTPPSLADLFRQAAKLIHADGYTPQPAGARWQQAGPHSVSSAIEAAAMLRHPASHADAADLAEDALARLGGFLHLTGQRTRRTSIADMCTEVAWWEDCQLTGWPQCGTYRTQAEAAAILESAGTLLDHLGDAS